MRHRGRAWTALTLCVALAASSCGEAPDDGDQELHGLPPIQWSGSHIEFGTDVDAKLCPATLMMENEYMQGVDEYVRSSASYPIRYFHLRKELDQYGLSCGGLDGCIRYYDGTVFAFSKLVSHRHELIHASSVGGEHGLLEEGLATFLGTDLRWYGIADPLEIRAAFESVEIGGGLPSEFYPVAGHFISFLVEEYGLPAVVSLIQNSDPGMTLDELDELAVEHLGHDIRIDIDAYEASGPGCEVAQYSPTWLQCDLAPPSIPIFSCTQDDSTVHVDIELSCQSGASGVQDGMIWRDVLVDIPAPALTRIYLYEGHPVDFVIRGCGSGCSTPFAEVSSESTEPAPISDSFEVGEGLHVVRIFKPIEAEGSVRFDIGGLCP